MPAFDQLWAGVEQRKLIKRAFDLAPNCGTIGEVNRRLIAEGYTQVNAHLAEWQIRRELLRRLKRGLAPS
jgi:hypothetical protein